MAVLRIKDGNNWVDIQTIKGYTPVKGVDYFTPADIASLNIPTKTSDLTNDSGFITSIPNSSASTVGGIKTYFDTTNNILYITNDGSDPTPNA